MRSVVIIDDHRVFADVLGLALAREPDLECLGHAPGVVAGASLVDRTRPDVVVMDVHLCDGDGLMMTAELTAKHPSLCVVVLTAFPEPTLMQRAVAADASALLSKDGDLLGTLQTLRTVTRDGFIVDPDLMRRLVGPSGVPAEELVDLNPREQQVLQMLATGLDARLIARDLGISLHTCRGYVKSLLAKLGAHSQLEAVAIAMRNGSLRVQSYS